MPYTVPGTLAHYQALPFQKLIPTGHLPTSLVAGNCKTYFADANQTAVSVEKSAIDFYCLNHLAAMVRENFTPYEKLPDWAAQVMDAYEKCLAEQSLRMFTYVLLITTRETRHHHNGSVSQDFWNKVVANFGKEIKDWINHINKHSDSIGLANHFMANPPPGRIGQYIQGLSYVFHHGSYSSGYGGPKWGVVADALASVIAGKTSMEMFLDTGYTLAHNGGPIFNKGMLFATWDHELYRILDVQHSGQIPEYVLEGLGDPDDTKAVRPLVMLVRKHLPDKFAGYVDWHKVEAMGSKQKYPTEKKNQAKKGKGSANIQVVGQFPVFKDQSVLQYKRVKAA